jgi:hypothetical protein
LAHIVRAYPYRQHDGDVFLYAFDLIELNGDDNATDVLIGVTGESGRLG